MKEPQRIAEQLLERVMSTSPGRRLPSIRSLMKIHDASLYSVSLAVKGLKEGGLIETKRGNGIYVSAQKGVRYIELHRPLYPSAALDSKERSFSQAMGKEGWQLLVKHHRVNGDAPEILVNPKASAHIVMLDLLASGAQLYKEAIARGIPVLVYGRTPLDLRMDYVTGDDYQYMSMLAKHLLSLGHRRIALLANEPNSPDSPQVHEILSRILDVLDLPAPVLINCHTLPGENSAKNAYRGLRTYLESHQTKPAFTAIIIASPSGVVGSLRALHEVGLRVPRDCSIASFGLSLENTLLVPSITEVGVEEPAWGDAAVKTFKQRFKNPKMPPMAIKLSPVLHVRESTSSPNT